MKSCRDASSTHVSRAMNSFACHAEVTSNIVDSAACRPKWERTRVVGTQNPLADLCVVTNFGDVGAQHFLELPICFHYLEHGPDATRSQDGNDAISSVTEIHLMTVRPILGRQSCGGRARYGIIPQGRQCGMQYCPDLSGDAVFSRLEKTQQTSAKRIDVGAVICRSQSLGLHLWRHPISCRGPMPATVRSADIFVHSNPMRMGELS